MQIILLLLLSSTLFAQKHNPVNQCDPVAAEKECYNLLCTPNPNQVIPLDPEALTAAYKAHPYELPSDIAGIQDKLGKVSDSIKEAGSKLLNESELNKLVSELSENPTETMGMLSELYKGELNCIYKKEQKCILVSSDLKKQSEEFKVFFKNLNDNTYLFRFGILKEMDTRKDKLYAMLDMMKGQISNDQMKVEKKKIRKLKRESDYMIYMMETSWLNDYKKKLSNDFKPYAGALAASLKQKIKEYLEIDLSSDKAKLRLKNSCQLASFIKTSLEKNVTPEKFEAKKLEIINSVKTKFLPKLSAESAAKLSENLKPSIFFQIPETGSYHPFQPILGPHKDGYIAQDKNSKVLKDLTLLPLGEEFRCQSKGMLTKDFYNFGFNSINISSFALANNFNDVISHEIGHWLSAQMRFHQMSKHSRKKLEDVRKCVRNFYPTDKEDSQFAVKLSGDKTRTEEDFADWFSATSGLGESGLFCDLKKMTNNFVGSNNESSYLPQMGDPHSNFLFREMTLRLNRGETLPQSCKDLNDYYPEVKSQKCEW